jgi:hypothetical protein
MKMIGMKKQILKIIPFLSLLLLISVCSFPQGRNIISPSIQLQYFKNTEDHRILQATLTYSENRMALPLPGMEISFYKGIIRKEILIREVTDDKGIARFTIDDDVKLPVDNKGLWNFSSEFKGNDTIKAAASELSIKDVTLEMSLSEVDSVKNITINAFSSDAGKKVSVSGESVLIYVPRMFSLLPVAEAKLDENGKATVEFPSDLPGDDKGNITIIARFEEHPAFGNVEKRIFRKWGLPTHYSIPASHRALWTKTPPRWMIITLSILLTGVWAHYLFAIISLFRIRLEAKRKKAQEEYRT